MNVRLVSSVLALLVFFAFPGHATNYATGLYENQQPKATAYTASVPQVSSPLPKVQKSNGEAQAAMLWTDGERTGYIENGNAFDGRGNQIGRNVVPGEEIRAVGQGRIGSTQGGNDVIYNPAGDAIGIVRPSGESHGVEDGRNEAASKIVNQNSNEKRVDIALRNPQAMSKVEQQTAENFCKAQEPITEKHANRIAYGKIMEFDNFAPNELALVIRKNGGVANYSWGTPKEVGYSYSDDSFVHIHSHPFEEGNQFSGWPSHGDIVSMFRKDNWLSQLLKDNGCSQGRKFYNYIVYFGDGSLNLGRRLIRYDENGVYDVMNENGDEKLVNMSDEMKRVVNEKWKTTLEENLKILNGELDYLEIAHRPFNFNDSMEMKFAKKEANNGNSGIDTNGSVLAVVKKTAADSEEVKKVLEEFHLRFLSLPNSQFKRRDIQAYLDLVVSLQTFTFPQDKVSKYKVSAYNLSWKDLVDSAQSFAKDKDCWAQEKVGIRGWCKCQPLHVTKRDSCFVDVSTEVTQDNGGAFCNLLGFRVCEKCGKCYTYRKLGDDSYDVTFTVWPYEETAEERISQTLKFCAALAKMEDAILSIPDGEIVVPIKKMCSCKLRSGEKPHLVAIDDGPKGKTIICTVCCGLYSTR